MDKNVGLVWITAVLLSLFISCRCIRITSCSRDPSTDIVKIKSLSSTHTPVKIPGEISFSIVVEVNQPITGNLQADVTLSRNLGGMWIDVPCVSTTHGNFGSCTYHDVCNLLENINGTCPQFLANNSIPCKCPVPSATYTVPQVTIPIDLKTFGLRIPGISGDYQASIRVTDTDTLTEIICFDVEVEVTEPSTPSVFRSIGRFFVNLFGR
ncbi:hypothetical protein Btru_000333 [Bulinus truncatus]|nr:hypothetical protein Btru_000333 [Bulinus truncatus]